MHGSPPPSLVPCLCAQELLAFLLDGLHEDLNRVERKPYIEAKDADGRPDDLVAQEYWDNHKARNDSIIVDTCQVGGSSDLPSLLWASPCLFRAALAPLFWAATRSPSDGCLSKTKGLHCGACLAMYLASWKEHSTEQARSSFPGCSGAWCLQGQYKSTLVCPVCSKVSVTFDPFMYLSLPLPAKSSRSMTVTVIAADGSSGPCTLTTNVLKAGSVADLVRNLSQELPLEASEQIFLTEVGSPGLALPALKSRAVRLFELLQFRVDTGEQGHERTFPEVAYGEWTRLRCWCRFVSVLAHSHRHKRYAVPSQVQ